jgi:gas vesicle structural protein
MSTAVQPASASSGALDRPSGSGLAEVVDTILDKGLVIDAFVRVSLVGIELLTIDARIVVASVDTYLRFAEAANRLDLGNSGGKGLPEFLEGAQESGAEKKVKGAAKGAVGAAGDTVRDFMGGDGKRERSSQRGSNGHHREES